jgi:putative FmdB family regulatory protein
MPTYEYECLACKKRFALLFSISEYGKTKASCPKCKSKKVKRIVSTFITKTSRKS